jgi:hypothetical protein
MAPRKKPETPGSRLKAAVLEKYELDPGELLILDHAAELADLCARIDAEVAHAPLTTAGSKGQLVPHPLLLQQRKHHERLQRQLEALRLPAKDEVIGAATTSKSAQRAAQARWRKQKARGA